MEIGSHAIEHEVIPTLQEGYADWADEHPYASAFLHYAGLGLMDPKMPVEAKTFGLGYVALNVVGVGAILWLVDPQDKHPGGLWGYDWKLQPTTPFAL